MKKYNVVVSLIGIVHDCTVTCDEVVHDSNGVHFQKDFIDVFYVPHASLILIELMEAK